MRFDARALPAALGIQPSEAAAASTRSRTGEATLSGALKVRETVAVETPAATATSSARGARLATSWLVRINKLYHQRIGTFGSIRCRVITYDVRERFWALDAVLDKIVAGTEAMRGKIARFSENI